MINSILRHLNDFGMRLAFMSLSRESAQFLPHRRALRRRFELSINNLNLAGE